MTQKEFEFAYIDAHADEKPITDLVKETSVSRSGYYSWKKRGGERRQDQKDQEILPDIRKIFEDEQRTVGRKRLKYSYEYHFGRKINEKKVRRLMRKFGMHCSIRQKRFRRKPYLHTTIPNILDRNFTAMHTGIKLAIDITYIPVKKGNQKWVYCCAIKDLCNDEIVGYSSGTNQDMSLVYRAIESLKEKGFAKGAILHSDQGFQFTNPRYREYLTELGITQSMSRKGNCWDNACIENFFSHMKCEMPFHHSMETVKDIMQAIDVYVHHYNEKRVVGKIKMPPKQYRLQAA